jgi:hypothetical protein
MSLLRYLPQRTAEDILAGVVRVTLGRQEYLLPVLPIERNEQWQQAENGALGPILAGLDEAGAEGVAFLCRQAPTVYAQLMAYDALGIDPDLGRIEPVLPPWDEIRKVATEAQVVSALLGVMAAAYPLAVEMLRLVEVGSLAMALQATATPDSSAPTSKSRARSAGRRAKSAVASPMSN